MEVDGVRGLLERRADGRRGRLVGDEDVLDEQVVAGRVAVGPRGGGDEQGRTERAAHRHERSGRRARRGEGRRALPSPAACDRERVGSLGAADGLRLVEAERRRRRASGHHEGHVHDRGIRRARVLDDERVGAGLVERLAGGERLRRAVDAVANDLCRTRPSRSGSRDGCASRTPRRAANVACWLTISGWCRSPIGTIPNFAETSGCRFIHRPRLVTPAARSRIRNSGSWSAEYCLSPHVVPVACGGEPGVEGQIGLHRTDGEDGRGLSLAGCGERDRAPGRRDAQQENDDQPFH